MIAEYRDHSVHSLIQPPRQRLITVPQSWQRLVVVHDPSSQMLKYHEEMYSTNNHGEYQDGITSNCETNIPVWMPLGGASIGWTCLSWLACWNLCCKIIQRYRMMQDLRGQSNNVKYNFKCLLTIKATHSKICFRRRSLAWGGFLSLNSWWFRWRWRCRWCFCLWCQWCRWCLWRLLRSYRGCRHTYSSSIFRCWNTINSTQWCNVSVRKA